MILSVLYLLLMRVLGVFRSDERAAAEAELENAVLGYQIAILRRQVKRPIYRTPDRALTPLIENAWRRSSKLHLLEPADLTRVAQSITSFHRPAATP